MIPFLIVLLAVGAAICDMPQVAFLLLLLGIISAFNPHF